MKLTKKTGSRFEDQAKISNNKWKDKAIARRKELEKLRRENRDLRISRESWKAKYKSTKTSIKKVSFESGQKARGHQYSLALVVLILELYKYGGMSLRSCRHSVGCMLVCMGLNSRLPSHTSIRNWLCKCGVYRVKSQVDERGDYVIYVDKSITFGSEKILLILGIAKEKMTFVKALRHEDVEVLYVGISKEWKAECIEEIVNKVSKGKHILYAVSDEGRNLIKAYKLLNYSHIKDCTHKLANYIKHLYEKGKLFESLRKLIGKLRQAWNLSKTKSEYMPPSMRGKLRFTNIFPCVNWAKKRLAQWDDLPEEIQSSLSFLKENSDFIQSLIEVEMIFKTVCQKLKKEGFGVV